MVTMNIPVDDSLMERLRELADGTGQTVEQAAAALLSTLAGGGRRLSADEEASITAADAEIDRGEFVSEADLFGSLAAQRGRAK